MIREQKAHIYVSIQYRFPRSVGRCIYVWKGQLEKTNLQLSSRHSDGRSRIYEPRRLPCGSIWRGWKTRDSCWRSVLQTYVLSASLISYTVRRLVTSSGRRSSTIILHAESRDACVAVCEYNINHLFICCGIHNIITYIKKNLIAYIYFRDFFYFILFIFCPVYTMELVF